MQACKARKTCICGPCTGVIQGTGRLGQRRGPGLRDAPKNVAIRNHAGSLTYVECESKGIAQTQIHTHEPRYSITKKYKNDKNISMKQFLEANKQRTSQKRSLKISKKCKKNLLLIHDVTLRGEAMFVFVSANNFVFWQTNFGLFAKTKRTNRP